MERNSSCQRMSGSSDGPGQYPAIPGNDTYARPRQLFGAYNTVLPPAASSSQLDRSSYYLSKYPLYASDWVFSNGAGIDCVALSSYREGFSNTIQILHGITYGLEATGEERLTAVEGFDFYKVAEVSVDYPVTNLQWDPTMHLYNGYGERLATTSDVLRLYQVDHETLEQNNDYRLDQTHMLVNNTNNSPTSSKSDNDYNTTPPLTSFDWNRVDPNILITSSVDTTCTVWDLHRSFAVNEKSTNSATIKTQLIAHDSEVFDVKFLHNTTNIFASVGNDGSMRIFDLRSLEHSTIIYEPPAGSLQPRNLESTSFMSKALLKVSCSNVDQHHLAAFGVNSNQVLVIDMRMPGRPVVTIDGSLGGSSYAAINSIKWHPTSNLLLSGGDDCQALVWDCTQILLNSEVIDTPVFAHEEELEVNNVCWREDDGDYMGVVSGKGFQAVLMN